MLGKVGSAIGSVLPSVSMGDNKTFAKATDSIKRYTGYDLH